MSERRLGRGLESLLGRMDEPTPATVAAGAKGEVQQAPIEKIRMNPRQPRTAFAERELFELAESVKAVGILQPLLVRRAGDGYELIAGERRLRAARMAGLTTVPICERTANDEDLLTLALTENLQREDLNPIEKAKGFKELLDKHGLTQEAAAKRLGKERSTLANFVRLLDLPEAVQEIVSRETISVGHARALLAIPDPSMQYALARRIEKEGLSVRDVERIIVKRRVKEEALPANLESLAKSPQIRDPQDRIRQRLGTRVSLEYAKGGGKLVISFFSDDDFQRILDALGVSG